jgi:hypothetical protein
MVTTEEGSCVSGFSHCLHVGQVQCSRLQDACSMLLSTESLVIHLPLPSDSCDSFPLESGRCTERVEIDDGSRGTDDYLAYTNFSTYDIQHGKSKGHGQVKV